jgi:hypothetical protein
MGHLWKKALSYRLTKKKNTKKIVIPNIRKRRNRFAPFAGDKKEG